MFKNYRKLPLGKGILSQPPPAHPMYDGGLTYLTDSLKFLSHNSKQKYSFFKNLQLIVWFFCLIVLLHRITQITELKNARSFRF